MSRTVTEEHSPNDFQYGKRDGTEGLERIGDVLHRLIDERGWPLTVGVTLAGSYNPLANDDLAPGDV